MNDSTHAMTTSQKPLHEIKVGRIRATVWPNENEQRSWFTVTVTRSYRDGEVWKTTTSFNRDELPLVAKAAEMAYEWIWRHGDVAQEGR